MKHYALQFSGPNIYITANGVTMAVFVPSPPSQGDTQREDADCALAALQKAADERFTNAATQTEEVN